MRVNVVRYAAFCLIAFSAARVVAEPAAYLRTDGKVFYVAVKADPPLWNGKNPKGEQVADPDDILKHVVASAFLKNRLISVAVSRSDGMGSDFVITLPEGTVPPDDMPQLLIAVQNYPVAEGQTSGFSATVTNEVKATLDLKTGNCLKGFPLVVEFSDTSVQTDYGRNRLKELFAYMRGVNPTVRVESQVAEKDAPRDVKLPAVFFGNPDKDGRFFQCLELTKDPPHGTFDVKFSYPAGAPLELRHPFLSKDVSNAAHAVAPFSLDETNIGKRTLEQNLDVGMQYGSSVADKKVKNAAGVEELVRMRDTRGTLDLRVAPLLNVLSLPDPGESTFKFLTPLLIDARVSTGKINDDTLSLNRIVFGGEYEIRHYTNPSTYPTYQRYIFSFRNASDRDFKQAEWKGGFEFQPVFSALNRPLRFRRKTPGRVLDTDPERAPKDIPVTIGFGGQFLPLVGFEAGKTWRNKRTSAAVEKTTFVRRFYFGGTLNLDLTAYVKVSIKDILYIRGESEGDRLHSYFLGTVQVPLPSFTRNSAGSAFFSFERGGQPPFATPDVNAVKLGYRVQWDGWFGQRR